MYLSVVTACDCAHSCHTIRKRPEKKVKIKSVMTKAVVKWSGGKHGENKSNMFNSLDLFIFTT